MSKKIKVVMSDQVKRKLAKMNKRDKKVFNDMVEKIKKNPKTGSPMELTKINALPWELCQKCKKLLSAMYDQNSKEVYFNCNCGESFWGTKKEIVAGRRRRLIKTITKLTADEILYLGTARGKSPPATKKKRRMKK